MFSKFGTYFTIQTWGESHGKAIGAVIDGIQAGIAISTRDIQIELNKRRPGRNKFVSSRIENDTIEILSGIHNGKTTGHPISIIIWNKNQNSKEYDQLKNLFKPGHAAFTYFKKYGIYDHRGSGRASARETANWVVAGAIAKKILSKKKLSITAYLKEVGNIAIKNFDRKELSRSKLFCPDPIASRKIERYVDALKKEGDSIGGIVEIIIENVPVGLGDPVFEKLDANLAKALMSIPAVKGIEIGDGFKLARLKGSVANDIFIKKGKKIATKTNRAGGILGGISNGMPIVARIAIKPASSIGKEQEMLDIAGKKQKVSIKGRHDPCIAIRAVPVAQAMCAITILEAMMRNDARKDKRK